MLSQYNKEALMKKEIESNSPVVLVILDGFGYRKETQHNAIALAQMPTLDYLTKNYPHTLIDASGAAVGLPPGIMGNSEVGHMTIGAGRCIKQMATRINEAIQNRSFFKNPILLEQLKNLPQNKALHFIGLCSDAQVHSNIKHLKAYLKAAQQQKIKTVYIHAILDGRDTPPQSAQHYLELIETLIKTFPFAKLGSIAGRYYAMDRDTNWDRTKRMYDILTRRYPPKFTSWHQALAHYYNKNITDEFIPPTQLDPQSIVQSGDGIIFFNFRPDRARQLTAAFVQPDFNHFKTKKILLSFFITPGNYKSKQFETIVLFGEKPIKNTLKDILQRHNKRFYSIAETEKYAHITYFFAGGKEKKYPNETRILIPSLAAKTYANFPCMSAPMITKQVLETLKGNTYDFYLINYANADMVGHSGDLDATIKAIECLDKQIERLYAAVIEQKNGMLIITADHGNAEDMFDEKVQQPKTAHTNNQVPFMVIQQELKGKKIVLPVKELADITPFIGKLLNIE